MIINITGNNNIVNIGKEVSGNNVDICIQDDNNELVIGDNTYFAGNIHFALTEGKKINIDKDCLFSNSIVVRTGDSHSIVDMKSKKRVNLAKAVTIGNHVWITERVLILKGTLIGNDSIVASNSVITKEWPQTNVVLGGGTTRILKNNINWSNER
ncbi:MAG: hypothetical protein IJ068_05320 [Bacilli bacterium]|nr:hypothetical protein [Bacilli bacterium]